jgi:hypothetical protein
VSAPSFFEERLKEVTRMIERLREEGWTWEDLSPLEIERRALEWIISTYCTLKNISRSTEEGGDRQAP